MPIEQRAKQFAPFAAIRGLQEALERMERVVVEKVELSEEMAEELNWKMQMIKGGELVTVVYFSGEQYLKKTGIVARINQNSRIIQIVDTRISFDDLYDLEIN